MAGQLTVACGTDGAILALNCSLWKMMGQEQTLMLIRQKITRENGTTATFSLLTVSISKKTNRTYIINISPLMLSKISVVSCESYIHNVFYG
jgi:hypothetical protein